MNNRKRVLITGAAGFLGESISRYLIKNNYEIVAIGRGILAHFPGEFYRISLPNNELHKILVKVKPSVVIHCAGSSSVENSIKNPYGDFSENVNTCAFVLESIRLHSPSSQFIYLSSAAVYGNPKELPIRESTNVKPISPYGYHKLNCESLVEEYSKIYGLQSVILRIFSAYGEGLKRQVIFDLCKKFLDVNLKEVNVYGTGKESRDFIHVDDIASIVKLFIEKEATGIYNIASGTQTYISDIVEYVKNGLDSEKEIIYNGNLRQGDPKFWQADISKLIELGFRPEVSIQEGIIQYCNWIKKELLHEKDSYRDTDYWRE